jgi:NAD+-dependent protein deacetylase SIR2
VFFYTVIWQKLLIYLLVDTLERRAGIPEDRIVEAHGSFATQRCINCKTEFDNEEMRQHIKEKRVPKCKGCKGLVKPDIVFFGEAVYSFNLIYISVC